MYSKSLDPPEAPQRGAGGAAPGRGHGGRGGRGPGAAEAVSGGPLLCFDRRRWAFLTRQKWNEK